MPSLPAVSLGVVHLVDHQHARQVHLAGVLPHPVGHRLGARLRVHHHQRRLHRQHRGARLMQEHVESRRVQQVDLHPIPLRERGRIGHRRPPGHLFLVVRRHRRTVVHAPLRGRHLGRLQQRRNQGCLAAVRMAYHRYVPDVPPEIVLHSLLLFPL